MNMLVNVKSRVTTREILPGIAVRGIMKLKLEAKTMVMHGK